MPGHLGVALATCFLFLFLLGETAGTVSTCLLFLGNFAISVPENINTNKGINNDKKAS